MTADVATRRSARPVGQARPRIAPPVPARSELAAFKHQATELGIDLMPWQEIAARYLTALAPGGRHLYREVAIVVARQNGKTHLARPLIVQRLIAGERILHIAQTRELPRQMFAMIADSLPEELFQKRRGKGGRMITQWPRYGSGQEEILLQNGGSYRIAAATRGSARGQSTDTVLIDELREMTDDTVIAAAEPTLMASDNPQIIYLSNAGTDASVVLNGIRLRAASDSALAYLEWSAAPDRAADDHDGWAEANPAIGHLPGMLRSLEAGYTRHRLEGTMSSFETENLCRWVASMREPLVDPAQWALCEVDGLPRARKSYVGISMDPSGTRAAVARAWQSGDGTVSLELLINATGDPIDTDQLGTAIKARVSALRATSAGYDPMTDAELAKYLRATEPISGPKWANASAQFVNLVQAGRLRWAGAAAIGDDLTWTARKAGDERGQFSAVRANDDRPIPAALAAIRAVWLASGPKPPRPRVY